MVERTGTYFVSDVHLGLHVYDPKEREERFVSFLKSIPKDSTKAVYLLGDIWDFWYEYKDVVPKEAARVVVQLVNLVDAGVEVYFVPGNHDIWCFRFFEELGIKKVSQPYFTEICGKRFCLGHGDGIGGAKAGYRLMNALFHNRVAQALFSTLHPWLAYRLGTGWSSKNRQSHKRYVFIPEKERIFAWAKKQKDVDYFVFGHYHNAIDEPLPGGARFILLDTWFNSSPYLFFDGKNLISASFSE